MIVINILQTADLKKYYGAEPNITKALDGVSFSVKKGEFVAVVGTSGSGKSTLLHMMGGLDVPTSGTVTVRDMELSQMNDEQLTLFRRRNIGFVFQSYNLVPIFALNEESWRYFQAPAFTDIVGKPAKAENEIMLSRAHLSAMGIDEPYIGMEIFMEFEIGDLSTGEYGEKQQETFTLSLIYTEYVSANPGNMFTPVFVSEAFAERYGMREFENSLLNVIFTNQSRAVEFAKRMAQDLNLEYGLEVVVHPRQFDLETICSQVKKR